VRRHLEEQSRAMQGCRGQQKEAVARPGSGGTTERMELTCRAHVSAVEEIEGESGKRRNSKEKA
jgi:hypothetical protein